MIVQIDVDRVKDDAPNWVLRGRERTVVRLVTENPPDRQVRWAKTIWHDGENTKDRHRRMIAGKGRRFRG